jgi:D-alanyl-D-alanine dipeptidase
MKQKILLVLALFICSFLMGTEVVQKGKNLPLPKGFVYLGNEIPSAIIDLRYYGSNNFLGEPVDGYEAPRLILTRQAVEALKAVQRELEKYSMTIKVFDGYRPQQAVNHFVRWAKEIRNRKMKKQYYPDVKKENLFKDGYIASKSSHSRGSTVDLTIVFISHGKHNHQEIEELDMGTLFDFFGKASASEYPDLSPAQRVNRLLLRTLMEKHGFKHYSQEWWHFTLKKESFPDTFFDFPVK